MSERSAVVGARHRRAWHPLRPHNALPDLPPAGDPETKAVLKQCVTARAALADLKRAADLMPTAGLLEICLPLLEAQASSAIEHVVTTADTLFRHVRAEAAADPATRAVLDCRTALFEGCASLKTAPLGWLTALQVCGRIVGASTGRHTGAGGRPKPSVPVRRDPGAVIVSQAGSVIYTPPVGEVRILALLDNWAWFLHDTTPIDPLIRMAVAHYQFEAIHPFADGNGRTGRILNTLFLVDQGLLSGPILSLSRYLNAQRAEYYRRLLDVTRTGAWEPWLIFILHGVEETAVWTAAKIDAVRRLQEEAARVVRARLPKLDRPALLDVVFRQPCCRIADVVDAGIANRQTASRHLHALAAIDVLCARRDGRDVVFVNQRLLRLLTEDANTFERYT